MRPDPSPDDEVVLRKVSASDSLPVTVLLQKWRDGDQSALDLLTPIVYSELRRLAGHSIRRERPGHTLQPTALLHEAYAKLAQQGQHDWQNRAHFFGVAAHIMRLILVDHARKKKRIRRGSGAVNLQLNESLDAVQQRPALLVQLDDALNELAKFDERKAKVIEMRFFAGMSLEETAEALGVGVATIGREQRLAQAWIGRYLSPAEEKNCE
ncbi:sigma-70 family RNA polymerase sigma factor [Bryobacter aggregatus]|uniref:sigma-70 family RNA polymerase sigma factor n=1 Tax=Bryobacter aggregatus TaxID=360054 RepID=UPI0009B5B106|nr:sigma-70 family RNA polymerase sigma factor [Bryobacter aggregatus]